MAGKNIKQFKNLDSVEKLVSTPAKAAISEGKADIEVLWKQLLSRTDKAPQDQKKGDLVEGQEISLKAEDVKKEEKPKARVEAGFDYTSEVLHSERRISREGTQQISIMIEQIRLEIKKLASETKELKANVEIAKVAIEEVPENPGKYHLNFFEWLLTIVRDARIRVEDSSAWMSAFNHKKGRKDYWGLFKKHGTSFGLSGERVAATQTG